MFELDFIGFPHLARIQMRLGKDSGHFGVYVSVSRLKKGVEKNLENLKYRVEKNLTNLKAFSYLIRILSIFPTWQDL